MQSRSLDDFSAARNNLYQSFADAASQIAPMETDNYRLEISDVGYDDDEDPDQVDYDSQTRAVNARETLGRRLRGTWQLFNKADGSVQKSRRSLAIVPRVNEDGTMIYRGARYAMTNQTRLKPSAYARAKKNGEYESFVSVKPGTGPNHRYILNPETGRFFLNLGHSRIPLPDVLRELGATDDQMREAWGPEIAEQNFKKSDPKSRGKLYERLVRRMDQTAENDKEKTEKIRQAFAAMELDPWTTERTVGKASDRVTPEVILSATRKVLAMFKGEADGDDRDQLSYQTFHAVEDLIPERVRLDKDGNQRKYARKVIQSGALDKLPTGLLQSQIEAALFGSGLAVQPEYANPLDALGRATRVSKAGEGGLPSSQSTPMESRDVHPSQIGFIDPSQTAESLKVGVDLSLAKNAVRGEDGKLRVKLRNARTGEMQLLSPEDVLDATVAVSPVGAEVDGYAGVIRRGREDFAKPEQIDYYMDNPAEGMFNHSSLLVPFRSGMAVNRLAMAGRVLGQSVPLVNRESPVVQSAVPGTEGKRSYYQEFGKHVGAVHAPTSGRVKEVTPGYVLMETDTGDRKVSLHRSTPLGSKTSLRNIPSVKVGQEVQEGQLLAGSNFTNDKGDVAMSLNATVAFTPWGDNYEDALTVSESFAKRMTSEQMYREKFEPEEGVLTGKNEYMSVLPSSFNKKQLESLDDTGVVKIGQKVSRGDPLVLAAKPRISSSKSRVHRKGAPSFRDETVTWEHNHSGVVSDVYRGKNGEAVVHVATEAPLEDGDKVSSIFGDKGVVRVIPDSEMISDEDGRAYDVAASDLGIISRGNAGRVHTAFLGKIAKKTGRPYFIDEFTGGDFDEYVQNELKKHDMTGAETVVDPRTGRRIKKVGTGVLPMFKLHHLSESKSHARGIGRYGTDQQPAKGSDEGGQAKRLSNQELGGLVSHGAYEFLRESSLVRGQRNDEYWARYLNGVEPPTPEVPFVYKKFLSYLKGVGINPSETGSRTKLLLMTDDDTKELSGDSKVRSGETLDFKKGQKEIEGGLFDSNVFGEDGERWSRYELSEPLPHPLMEDTIRNLMGVTKDKYRKVLAGEEELGEFGSGPKALQAFLGSLNVGKEMARARSDIKDSRKTRRDSGIKRLRYLKGLEERDIDPKTLMVQQVPILPPKMRPISILSKSQTPLIDGMNLLYGDMIEADKNLRELSKFGDTAPKERMAVYDAVQAAYGLRQPVDPELRQKNVTGLMKRLISDKGPKHNYVNRRLLSGTMDSVGRGVVVPSTKLKLDEIGIPEQQAWAIYKMPTLRRLVRANVPLAKAMEMFREKDPVAKKAMLDEMEVRPVVASRAPVLHKFGIMGFKPKLMQGSNLVMNPLVHAGYNLDHDGDASFGTVTIAVSESNLRNNEGESKKALEKILGLARVLGISRPNSNSKRDPMASISRAQLPVLQGYEVIQVDLSNFPKGRRTNVSKGRCGEIYWHAVPEGTKVLAVNPKTGEPEWAEVTRWTEHHGCEVEIVELSNGESIFTDDDPRGLFGVDPSKSLDLTCSTPSAAKRSNLLIPRAAKLVIDDADAFDTYTSDPDWQPQSYASKYVLREDFDLDGGSGWLLGAHAADGWVLFNERDQVSGVALAKSNPLVQEKWKAELLRLVRMVDTKIQPKFGRVERDKDETRLDGSAYGGTVRTVFCASCVGKMLHELCGHLAENKRLPDWFLMTVPEFRAGLLAGFIDTDSTVAASKPTRAKPKPQLKAWYNTTSAQLARQVVLLSLSNGVQARMRWSKTTEADKDAWVVEWRPGDLKQFVSKWQHLLVDEERKRVILETEVDVLSSSNQRKNRLPITYELAATLRSKLGLPKDPTRVSKEHRGLYSALATATRKGFISREKAKLIHTYFDRDWLCKQKDACKFLAWVANESISWEYIENVEKTGKVEVGYDLSVPGYENWMTSTGSFVPNTMNFHAVLGDDAADEVRRKMFPTSSLRSLRDLKSSMFVPGQDHALGLWSASTRTDEKSRPRVFTDADAVRRAFQRGEISIDTPVTLVKD